MKDAFENDLEVGDTVIYSTKGGAGTVYVIGKIATMLPTVDNSKSMRQSIGYTPPDRVSIKVTRHNCSIGFSKNPIIYASNVVKTKKLPRR